MSGFSRVVLNRLRRLLDYARPKTTIAMPIDADAFYLLVERNYSEIVGQQITYSQITHSLLLTSPMRRAVRQAQREYFAEQLQWIAEHGIRGGLRDHPDEALSWRMASFEFRHPAEAVHFKLRFR